MSSAWRFSFLLSCKPTRVATLHYCILSKASNYLYICLKSSLLLGAGASRPGPASCDTKQTSTALGISAQWSGLGGAASYPERVGSFPCNEIDSKRTKLLSTPAHPLTAMKAKRGMGNCRPRAMKEKKGKKNQQPLVQHLPTVLSREEVNAELAMSVPG